MTDYTWSTDSPHANNTETMTDYLDNHLSSLYFCQMQDGSYAEIIDTIFGNRYAVHASGDGDFNNHRVRFELLNNKPDNQ